MSKVGAVVFEIDEALYEAMNRPINEVVMLNIANRLGVPYDWVANRYNELLEDW